MQRWLVYAVLPLLIPVPTRQLPRGDLRTLTCANFTSALSPQFLHVKS
jgi:hypothetical protein